jgi:Periplasmic binding protein domain
MPLRQFWFCPVAISISKSATTSRNVVIPWLMQQTGTKQFYLPSADYIWPRVMNKRVREVVTANGGAIVGDALPLSRSKARPC